MVVYAHYIYNIRYIMICIYTHVISIYYQCTAYIIHMWNKLLLHVGSRNHLHFL